MLQGFAMLIEEKDGTGLLKEETGALVSPLCFDVIALSSLFTSSSQQIWKSPLKVALIQQDGSTTYEEMGELIVWQEEGKGFKAIALMDCPWMVRNWHAAIQ